MPKLHIKHLSKESFIFLMQHIVDNIPLRKIYFSQKEPLPTEQYKQGSLFAPYVSLEIPINGKKHICFADKTGIQDIILKPGEILFSSPINWKTPQWDDNYHEMSSILFFPEYIRITYIDYNRFSTSYEYRAAETFYHTSVPLTANGISLLELLVRMSETDDDTSAIDLLQALLKFTLNTLKNDTSHFSSKAEMTWLQVKRYMQDNFCSPINRAHVASFFKLHPSYISQLFKRNGSENFNSMLRRLRLEHATKLLKQTNLTIDEITDSCGYLSSTYFISAFHKHFGLSPGKYRNL